jgi:hypothetical protein
MTIIKPKFYRTRTDEERSKDVSKVYTVRFNGKERAEVAECMRLLRQPKRSTAIKQLMKIGIQSVLHDQKTRALLGIVGNNDRRNDKLGIVNTEMEMKPM